jgi:hypothetical protein
MFYTLIPPDHECDRVHLYPSLESASAASDDTRPIYQVALELAAGRRLVVSGCIDRGCLGPDWMTGAQLHGDGSVTAKGPIPIVLFIGCVFVGRSSSASVNGCVRSRGA